MYPNGKCYLYFNICDYQFGGWDIVFPGAPIACVLVTVETDLNQNIYSFIPVCANVIKLALSSIY